MTKAGVSNTGINVTEWAFTKSARMADLTHSGTSGWALNKASVLEAAGSVKAYWDSDSDIDATVGIHEGAEVTLFLKIGDSSEYFAIYAIIENLIVNVNNQTGFVHYEFNFKSTQHMTPAAGSATSAGVTAPASVTSGTAFSLTLSALDISNYTAGTYQGTMHFTSSDGSATLPGDSTLSLGTGAFSATLKTVGSKTITATDTVTTSITGTTTITVN